MNERSQRSLCIEIDIFQALGRMSFQSSNEEVKKGFRGFELRSFAERRSIMENLLDLCIRWKVICLLEDWKKMLVCKENGEIMPGEIEKTRGLDES